MICLVGLSLPLGCTKSKATPLPLSGQLNVLVRPPNHNVEPISIDRPEAVPVRSGGAMCLDVQLNQPAYIYLVWIDPSGQFIPLYPWNNEILDIKDIDQPPPERRPAKLIFSPLLGKSWTFGDQAGAETVLLLARRTALPGEVRLGELLRTLPERPPAEVSKDLAAKGAKAEAKQMAAFTRPLTKHFDLVHAVQFAHAAETGENPTSESR